MCGLAGFMGRAPGHGQGESDAILGRMTDALTHRGPDSAGRWHDDSHSIWLGHRRLSIVDLSAAGRQPMHSPSGRYVIAFNGEIYNHTDLRLRLDQNGGANSWRGHSDTETLLAGFDRWGITGTVERSIGMFAFAVWDRLERKLILGRDRLGEKPLYYGWQGKGANAVFLFGSELKALRRHPAFDAPIDRGALALQLRLNCIPAPYSIYQNIFKLTPGTLLSVSPGRAETTTETYWSGARAAAEGAANPLQASPKEAVDQLEALLLSAVGQQMVADVPLGAFLSGGVDSSAVVALMQAQSMQPVRTFSIGFNEPAYNEAHHAKAVAAHLGTDHTELIVSASEAMTVIPELPGIYDEPFSDSSQIPTLLVSRLARRHVTVSLSGDGGDELFCGYNRYQMTQALWSKLAISPVALRRLGARALLAVSPQTWNTLLRPVKRFMPGSFRYGDAGDKLHKGAEVLGCPSADALYLKLLSHWPEPASIIMDGLEPPTLLTQTPHVLGRLDPVSKMMALDMLTYLPDDILVKVDRASMAVSLESRIPFLDHRVVEFAWRLPQNMKLRDGQSKWALRQVLYRHVPRELIERPKMGFGIPVDVWLRGPLREWAESLLSESHLKQEGIFHPEPIRKKWMEHLSGQRNWAYHLWDVLMFEAWHREQMRPDMASLTEPCIEPAVEFVR